MNTNLFENTSLPGQIIVTPPIGEIGRPPIIPEPDVFSIFVLGLIFVFLRKMFK